MHSLRSLACSWGQLLATSILEKEAGPPPPPLGPFDRGEHQHQIQRVFFWGDPGDGGTSSENEDDRHLSQPPAATVALTSPALGAGGAASHGAKFTNGSPSPVLGGNHSSHRTLLSSGATTTFPVIFPDLRVSEVTAARAAAREALLGPSAVSGALIMQQQHVCAKVTAQRKQKLPSRRHAPDRTSGASAAWRKPVGSGIVPPQSLKAVEEPTRTGLLREADQLPSGVLIRRQSTVAWMPTDEGPGHGFLSLNEHGHYHGGAKQLQRPVALGLGRGPRKKRAKVSRAGGEGEFEEETETEIDEDAGMMDDDDDDDDDTSDEDFVVGGYRGAGGGSRVRGGSTNKRQMVA